jgi:pantoate--beta-alanine ligase
MPETSTLPARPRVVASVREIQQFVRAQQRAGKRIGLVPTMGALHAGHLSLVERCRKECDIVVVSIFVNPKQFSPKEDFTKYPRELESDLTLLAPLTVDLVFTPSAEEIYPPGFATTVDVGGVTEAWEGASRPGHFRGVATVVLKLFQIVPADRAYFGRKDYQQLLTIRRMTTDLNLPIQIVECPLVREPDGLAMSSRNAYLSPDDRCRAAVLSSSLRLAHEMFVAGERDARKIRDAVQRAIAAEPGVQIEYVAVADPSTLAELSRIDTFAVVLVAARVGSTRLIDNEVLTPS